MVFRLFDNQYRKVLAEYPTRREAEDVLAQILESEPAAKHVVVIVSAGEGRQRGA